jgi:hypothetical protein
VAGTVTWFGRTWELAFGVVDGYIYEIAISRSTSDRTAAGADIATAFSFCKKLYGKPAEDDGKVACWDAANGNIALETNAGNEESRYFVKVILTSRRARTFKQRIVSPDERRRWDEILDGYDYHAAKKEIA